MNSALHTGIALMLHNELWSTSVGGKLITRFPGFPLKCRGNRQSIIIGIAHLTPVTNYSSPRWRHNEVFFLCIEK